MTATTRPASPNSVGVKISFFNAIDFGTAGNPERTADGALQVAPFDDLMATKLKAMLQRVEAKDYRGTAAMVRAGVGLRFQESLDQPVIPATGEVKNLLWPGPEGVDDSA